ncbi:MAG: hypothetical protein AB7E96_01735 [Deferribacterales bacterium]
MRKGIIISGIFPSKSLNWVMRPAVRNEVYPPAACDVNGELYQICGFENEENEYYVIEAESLTHALNMSVDIYGSATLNTVELANLTVICDRTDINHTGIDVFCERNIKGRQSFDTLRALTGFCPVLKRYLSVKDVPLKTIAVFDKLKNDCRRYVKNTVEDRDISVGDFRKLVNLLFDMQSQADEADFQGDIVKNLSIKKDNARISFMKQFTELTSPLAFKAESMDNFETGKLTFSFTAENAGEYEDIIKKASEQTDRVKEIFRFFDEQNIS